MAQGPRRRSTKAGARQLAAEAVEPGGGTGVDVGWASAADGCAAVSCGRRGGQLHLEALPVRELGELALLDGLWEGLLLRQVRGWYCSTDSTGTSSSSSSSGGGGTQCGSYCYCGYGSAL
jgi:hypothetical protein